MNGILKNGVFLNENIEYGDRENVELSQNISMEYNMPEFYCNIAIDEIIDGMRKMFSVTEERTEANS